MAKKNKSIEIYVKELSEYMNEEKGGFDSKDVIEIMLLLFESLFFNMISQDALLLSFMSVKDAVQKMDMDTGKAVEFLTKLYLLADKRRQQNFLSGL
jgi:acyl carrier protein